jgi:hypothetical protein
MKKTKITIHKQNELVRGADSYSLNAKRALNAVYWALQKYQLYNKRYFDFSFLTLRKIMNLENNDDYVKRMKEALRELMNTIELNNWTNPLDNKTYHWFATRFINEVYFFKNENGEWIARIETNQTIKKLMLLDSNFTRLDLLEYMNKFRTKYAMKLYEYLMSFKNYYYIEISQKHLMRLLNIKDDDKTYKNYANLKQLLTRQLKEIAKKTDLKEVELQNSPTLAKQKIFKIKIHKKKGEKQEKPGKELIENILKEMVKPMRF